MKLSLKAARINAGYTQKTAGRALGYSTNAIGGMENGSRTIRLAVFDAMCRLYGVNGADISREKIRLKGKEN